MTFIVLLETAWNFRGRILSHLALTSYLTNKDLQHNRVFTDFTLNFHGLFSLIIFYFKTLLLDSSSRLLPFSGFVMV